MSAIAVFTCVSGSHPFQERHINLNDPSKIGRSVAQARPGTSNTIFDCKVLSRNHALMWYEGGKFLLQDTKSSNGTFINSQRLSKGSEESAPTEVFSGDTIQFGVDVMENSRKVTHNCIIANVQLFHPNGQEAKSSAATSEILSHGVKSQELFQLAQCIQEATHRELALENKLVALQRLLQCSQEATERGWQALVDEDRLLSRLECLEDQLSVFAKGHSEDTLRMQFMALIEEKANYENAAKDSFRHLLEEKLDVARKVSDLEMSLSSAETESAQHQEACQLLQNELKLLAEKYEQQTSDLTAITEKLQEASKKLEDEEELKSENQLLQNRLEELLAHVESLQAENDFINEQMTNMKAKLEALKAVESPKISTGISRGIQTDLINLLDLRRLHDNASPEKTDNSDEEDDYENDKADDDQEDVKPFISLLDSEQFTQQLAVELQTKQSTIEQVDHDNQELSKLQDTQSLISTLQNKLHHAQVENTSQANKIQHLEDELSKISLERASQTSKVQHLEAHVRVLQEELDIERRRVVVGTSPASIENINLMQQEIERESVKNQVEFTKLKTECTELRQKIQDIELEMKQSRRQNEDLKEEYNRLQESYRELEQLKEQLQSSEISYHSNLTDAQKELELTKTELSATQSKLSQLSASSKSALSALETELSSTLDEYSVLSQTTRLISYCATFPLVILLFVILIAFHPLLSVVTATSPPT